MLKRLLSALVLLPVFLLIVIKAPGWMFNTLVVLASAAALWELVRLFEQAGSPGAEELQQELNRVRGVIEKYPAIAALKAVGSAEVRTTSDMNDSGCCMYGS